MSQKENITLGALMLKKIHEVEEGDTDVKTLSDEGLDALTRSVLDFKSNMEAYAKRADGVFQKGAEEMYRRKYDLKPGDVVQAKTGDKFFFEGFVCKSWDFALTMQSRGQPQIKARKVRKDGSPGTNLRTLYGFDEWKKV